MERENVHVDIYLNASTSFHLLVKSERSANIQRKLLIQKKKRDKLIKEKTKKGENTGKTKQGADKHTHYIIDIMENQILF